jgi:hypothetical protein
MCNIWIGDTVVVAAVVEPEHHAELRRARNDTIDRKGERCDENDLTTQTSSSGAMQCTNHKRYNINIMTIVNMCIMINNINYSQTFTFSSPSHITYRLPNISIFIHRYLCFS